MMSVICWEMAFNWAISLLDVFVYVLTILFPEHTFTFSYIRKHYNIVAQITTRFIETCYRSVGKDNKIYKRSKTLQKVFIYTITNSSEHQDLSCGNPQIVCFAPLAVLLIRLFRMKFNASRQTNNIFVPQGDLVTMLQRHHQKLIYNTI